jgi:hypothetical protein
MSTVSVSPHPPQFDFKDRAHDTGIVGRANPSILREHIMMRTTRRLLVVTATATGAPTSLERHDLEPSDLLLELTETA